MSDTRVTEPGGYASLLAGAVLLCCLFVIPSPAFADSADPGPGDQPRQIAQQPVWRTGAVSQLDATREGDCVALLHGLGRRSGSMDEVARKLQRSGFRVVNQGYPSLLKPFHELSDLAVGEAVRRCQAVSAATIHFVTHSLGGILVRYYLQANPLPELGRVVMMGPPNQGSKIVDSLSSVPGFGIIGPTGMKLGSGGDSVPANLPVVKFELGVIAGSRNLNPLGFLFHDGPNDSIVSVESTRVEGMREHITLPVAHTFMMNNNEVIDHTIHFLKTGNFMPVGGE